MFAASERETGQARRPRFAIGDRVRGKIVSIGQEVTVIELAGGGEGTLETLELRDEDGQLTVKEGDTLEARVVAHGEKQGFVTLRRGPRSGRPHQPRRGGRHRPPRRGGDHRRQQGRPRGRRRAACAPSARCRSSSCGPSTIRPSTSAAGCRSGSRATRRTAGHERRAVAARAARGRGAGARRGDARQGGRRCGAAGRGDGAEGLRRLRRRGRHRRAAAGVGDRLRPRHAPGRRADGGSAGDGAGDARGEARRSEAARAGLVLAQGARARSVAGRRRAVPRRHQRARSGDAHRIVRRLRASSRPASKASFTSASSARSGPCATRATR